jgi:hypothetical protein
MAVVPSSQLARASVEVQTISGPGHIGKAAGPVSYGTNKTLARGELPPKMLALINLALFFTQHTFSFSV